MGAPVESFDAVIVGAGMVGAACAYYLARSQVRVCVVDRGGVSAGTTGSGEGNVLISDKTLGPEMDLARLGIPLWYELAESLEQDIEFEPKGGIIVAEKDEELTALHLAAQTVRAVGVRVTPLDTRQIHEAEPHLAPDIPGGLLFPDDAQVQPMKACAALLQAARAAGASFRPYTNVTGLSVTPSGSVSAVKTTAGSIRTPIVVNAAGPWSPAVSAMIGIDLPVLPRKGHIMVTEPLPRLIHRKVYEAGYSATVNADATDVQIAMVVEGTRSGTTLLGSSRQLVGFDRTVDIRILQAILRRAIRFFPVLVSVRAIRAYVGFRPFAPDHLPIIGPDARVPGYYVNTGHEGAGIGLGPISAKLMAQQITENRTDLDLTPFLPTRFAGYSSPLS